MITALAKNNNFIDPLSRKTFKNDMFYYNRAVKAAVDWYSKRHPEVVFISDNKEIEI